LEDPRGTNDKLFGNSPFLPQAEGTAGGLRIKNKKVQTRNEVWTGNDINRIGRLEGVDRLGGKGRFLRGEKERTCDGKKLQKKKEAREKRSGRKGARIPIEAR